MLKQGHQQKPVALVFVISIELPETRKSEMARTRTLRRRCLRLVGVCRQSLALGSN